MLVWLEVNVKVADPVYRTQRIVAVRICPKVASNCCDILILTWALTAEKVNGCDFGALGVRMGSSHSQSLGGGWCGREVGMSMRGDEFGGRQMMPSWQWDWHYRVRMAQLGYDGCGGAPLSCHETSILKGHCWMGWDTGTSVCNCCMSYWSYAVCCRRRFGRLSAPGSSRSSRRGERWVRGPAG